MVIPEYFDYGNLSPLQIKLLKEFITRVEEDGYITVAKIQKFVNGDMAVINMRGKDPITSMMKVCNVDTRLLPYIENIIKGRVSYNFKIKDGRMMLPKSVGSERYDFTAPNDLVSISEDVTYTPQTPVEVLWRLVCCGGHFIWNGSNCVPMSEMYFGTDNFSINVDYIVNGVRHTEVVMQYDNGTYTYGDIHVCCSDDEFIFGILGDVEKEIITDDLERTHSAYKVNLAQYEKNMFDNSKFNKMYDSTYTFTVLDIMYKFCSYINGLTMMLKNIDSSCSRHMFALPCRAGNTFNIVSNKQHDVFTIQSIYYSTDIMKDVANVYKNHSIEMTEYLKNKDDAKRDELYAIFESECSGTYGILLHYYVNGVLDALGIQKGDKTMRVRILSDYIKTVHKEFLMYGCYFYDLRTEFLRNNFRIMKEFSSTILLNEYNGCYFRVG